MNEKFKDAKLISVCVYADTTGLFSESEYSYDNLADVLFPESIVREYFDEYIEPELIRPEETKDPFQYWLTEESTADDTRELVDFAESKGWEPILGIDDPDSVFYRDAYNFKHIVFEGTYDECRQFGKDNDWVWKWDEYGDYDDDDEQEEYELEILSEA